MKRICVVVLTGLVFVAAIGCDDEEDCPAGPQDPAVVALLSTSLHHTTDGMKTFYAAENGGLELLTGIPYEDLACRDACHVEATEDGCSACHLAAGTPPLESSCLESCHGRQELEMQLYSDVHRSLGFTCIQCHPSSHAHGDGTRYRSMLEPGAMAVDCLNCHVIQPENSVHLTHLEFDCSTCHVRSVVSCFSCHFDSEVEGQGKTFPSPLRDWKFLVQRDGKVHSANIMGITYQGEEAEARTFVTIAPYYAHTIYRPDPDPTTGICAECHDNSIVDEYLREGTMTAVWWDAGQGLQNFHGTIPVPADWQTSLKLSFATTEDGGQTWVHLKDEIDLTQMLHAEPLDQVPPQFDLKAAAIPPP